MSVITGRPHLVDEGIALPVYNEEEEVSASINGMNLKTKKQQQKQGRCRPTKKKKQKSSWKNKKTPTTIGIDSTLRTSVDDGNEYSTSYYSNQKKYYEHHQQQERDDDKQQQQQCKNTNNKSPLMKMTGRPHLVQEGIPLYDNINKTNNDKNNDDDKNKSSKKNVYASGITTKSPISSSDHSLPSSPTNGEKTLVMPSSLAKAASAGSSGASCVFE